MTKVFMRKWKNSKSFPRNTKPMKKDKKKITDNLPCAHCGQLTTAFYETSQFRIPDSDVVYHPKVKMCQKCIDEGWRPQMLGSRGHAPVLLCFAKTAKPFSMSLSQQTINESKNA